MDMLKCNRCGKNYSVRSMLADVSGKGLVCQACYDLITKVRTDADKLIQRRLISTEEGKSKKEQESARRVRDGKEYVCKGCNYRFLSSLQVKMCPYCGEMGRLMVMEDVVKEIDDLAKI